MATDPGPNPDAPRPVVTPPQTFRPEQFPRVSTDRPPGSSSGGGIGTVIASTILGLLAGGGGAWGYMNYIHPELARRQSSAGAPDTKVQAAAVSADQIDEISRRLDGLQARVEKLPKPSELPNLEPINQRLSAVDDLSRKLESQQARYVPLPEKIDENARKITAMMADLSGVRDEITTLRGDVQSNKAALTKDAAVKPAAGAAPETPTPGVQENYQKGLEQFQKRQFKSASETFAKLTEEQPDDARNWYFAALSRGFDTGNWKGETERLVNEGVTRERSGKPDKAEIDAAFSGLTAESGKDWLVFYRRRAADTGDRAAR